MTLFRTFAALCLAFAAFGVQAQVMPPAEPAAVPTLGHAGWALLSALVAGVGALRRRKQGVE